jgi:hypothetical protein
VHVSVFGPAPSRSIAIRDWLMVGVALGIVVGVVARVVSDESGLLLGAIAGAVGAQVWFGLIYPADARETVAVGAGLAVPASAVVLLVAPDRSVGAALFGIASLIALTIGGVVRRKQLHDG